MMSYLRGYVALLLLVGTEAMPEALEITQGLEEDQGCGADGLHGDLRLLQVKLSLQRSEDHSAWKADVHTAQTSMVSTSLPQMQIRYQNVSQEDLAWTADHNSMKQDALHEIVAGDVETSALGSLGGEAGVARPQHRAEWIEFSDDADPRRGFVKGDIQVGPATNESDVSHYNIFWASNDTTLDLIIALPKGIYQHHLASELDDTMGVQLPLGANQLIVKTSNAAGLMDGPGVATAVFDIWRPPLNQLLKGLLRG
eukprot:Skav213835  [mRNA]  locus=scaffold315:132219:140359:+ [translate_table: standard]